VDAQTLQDCLEDQCEQECNGYYCTARCRTNDDCEAAVDGQVGDQFTCHVGPNGVGDCLPGSLTPCLSSDDCEEDNEACALALSLDGQHMQGFCQTRPKCGAGPGEHCNYDPLEGDVVRCDSGVCGAGGCLEFCEDDDQCAYSDSLECAHDQRLFSNSNDTFSICSGLLCTSDADCTDEDYWCALGLTPEFTWENRCRGTSQAEGAAPMGEACNGYEDVGPVVSCAAGYCNVYSLLNIDDQRCGGICQTDEDCLADFRCLPNVFPVDDDDEQWTRWMAAPLCQYWPGPGTDCLSDAQCGDGEACVPVVFRVVIDDDGEEVDDGPDSDLFVGGNCRRTPADAKEYGEACGRGGPEECQSTLCLNNTNTCTKLCESGDECEDGDACLLIGFSNDFPGLITSVCASWRGSGVACPGPHGSCDGLDGAEEDEVCIPVPIAGTGAVDYRCGVSDGNRRPGENCRSGQDCESGTCFPLGFGGDGTCSGSCLIDDDCPNEFACLEFEFADAAGPWPPAMGKMCKPMQECVLCSEQSPCGEGLYCSYFPSPDPDAEEPVGVCLLTCETRQECEQRTDIDAQVSVRCIEAENEAGRLVDDVFVCAPRELGDCRLN